MAKKLLTLQEVAKRLENTEISIRKLVAVLYNTRKLAAFVNHQIPAEASDFTVSPSRLGPDKTGSSVNIGNTACSGLPIPSLEDLYNHRWYKDLL